MRSFYLKKFSDSYYFIRARLKIFIYFVVEIWSTVLLLAVTGGVFFFVNDIISTINFTLYFLGQTR